MIRHGEPSPASAEKIRQNNPPGFEQLLIPEQEVHRTLFQTYRAKAIPLDPVIFKDYDARRIEADLNHVADMEARFANEQEPEKALSMRVGEIAEALVWNGIENNGWLGPDAQVIVPSRYDDIENNIDEVAEFTREEGFDYLAISIDVTSSQRHTYEKLRKIRTMLQQGRLASMKYFHSEEAGFTGRKDNIPHVVVGFDSDTIRELSVLETKRMRLEQEIRSGADNQFNIDALGETKTKLGRHRAQMLLLTETRMQLETFEKYARTIGNDAIADKIKTNLSLIIRQEQEKLQELAPKREQRDELQEYMQNDGLYKTLVAGLKDFDTI